MSDDKLHVDATIAAANRTMALQAENVDLRSVIARLSGERDQLQAKLDEHELLFAYAKQRDEFLEKLLDGLAHQLPENTPRTVEGIVDAVAKVVLHLDAHEDASTPAFDDIAKLCGCPEWDYPGQVVRDVQRLVKERDEAREQIDFWRSTANALTPANVALLDKLRIAEAIRADACAASQRYLDEKREVEDRLRTAVVDRSRRSQVIAHLSNAVPYPEEWKGWESTRAKLVAEVGTMRNRVSALEDMAKDAHIETVRRQGAMLNTQQELMAQKNAAYAERDRCVAGLAALAVRLGWSAWLGRHPANETWDDDWRTIVFLNLPTGQVSWHVHDTEVAWFSFLPEIPERTWDGHTTEQKYERLAGLGKHVGPYNEDIALASAIENEVKRASRPTSPERIAYDHVYATMGSDGTPEERSALFWKKLREEQERQDKIDGEPCLAHTFVGDCCRDCGAPVSEFSSMLTTAEPKLEDFIARCGCSPKYVELAPGVHAKYCPLAGLPLEVSNG